MKKIVGLVLSIFLFYGIPVSLAGDSVDLVALKKKEEKRRKKTKKSKYVLTNSSLNAIKVPEKKYGFVQMAGYPDLVESGKEEAVRESEAKKDPKKQRKYWQELKVRLENEIEVLTKKVNEDQLRLNRLVTDHISMSLPLQKMDMKNQIDKMSASLNQDKLKLEDLRNQLNSLPEQARKAGVPPGWVR